MIMAGSVIAAGRRVEKPSELFPPDIEIRVKNGGPESRYASRGGLKLEAALQTFGINPEGKICLDIGSSTGGFTDCLLQHGAARVFAVDAGTNQMIWRLRNDPRVQLAEKTNARFLKPSDFPAQFEIAVMDVSFISVRKILPVIRPLMKPSGRLIVLIKPQFEVGKSEVGKGGIVKETEKHDRVINEIREFAAGCGFAEHGVIKSPITGADGNQEFLALYEAI
jgi:23S rRNA (cytidine1920-2'-O)/16S rRNA (cytidine1409-2'-O)-methyltransferase